MVVPKLIAFIYLFTGLGIILYAHYLRKKLRRLQSKARFNSFLINSLVKELSYGSDEPYVLRVNENDFLKATGINLEDLEDLHYVKRNKD